VPIAVTCNQCQFTVTVKDELAGKQGKCPKCRSIMIVSPTTRTTQRAADPSPTAPLSRTAVARPTSDVASAAGPAARAIQSATTSERRPRSPGATAVTPTAPVPLGRDQALAQVLAGFHGEIPQRGPTPTYLLGILLTSLFMVALPVIYVALIAVACWGVYLHMVHDVGLLNLVHSGWGAVTMLLVYLSPLFVGGILLVFMIKPLFARPAHGRRTRSFTRNAEPVLFALVDKICAVVNAPVPKRIDVNCDVNASASFRRGWLSAIVGNDLVLTIGMPLASGLSVQQFAGVLAHEFGHFSQGAGMRLTYVIRSINFWFLRVVYQRDSWDQWLANSARGVDLRVAWVLYLAQLCVWLVRQLLWALMMLGHVVTGFMLRQMEFDADRYEAHLAGSDTFESTARQLMLLSVAYQGAQSDAGLFYREGRLPDNLPKLMVANIKQIPEEARSKLNEVIETSKTGWFDSHPANKDRIAAAQELNAAGVFHSTLPARVLFSDFVATSRGVTYDFYCGIFGSRLKPDELHPVDDLIQRRGQDQQAGEARKRFFGGLFNTLRPWPLTFNFPTAPENAAATKQQLDAARREMLAAAPAYRTAFASYDDADTTIVQSQQLARLMTARVRIQRDHFQRQYASEVECREARDMAAGTQSQLAARLEPFEVSAGARLCAAIELLHEPRVGSRIAACDRKRNECSDLLPLVSKIQYGLPEILELRNAHAVLAALGGHLQGNEKNESLRARIRAAMDLVRERLLSVRASFFHIPYPFEHAKEHLTVGEFLLAEVPMSDDLGAIYRASDSLFAGVMSLYVRTIDRLCLIAEEVEAVVGFQPLDFPAAS